MRSEEDIIQEMARQIGDEIDREIIERLREPSHFIRALPEGLKSGDMISLREPPNGNYGLRFLKTPINVTAVYLGESEWAHSSCEGNMHILYIDECVEFAGIRSDGKLVSIKSPFEETEDDESL